MVSFFYEMKHRLTVEIPVYQPLTKDMLIAILSVDLHPSISIPPNLNLINEKVTIVIHDDLKTVRTLSNSVLNDASLILETVNKMA